MEREEYYFKKGRFSRLESFSYHMGSFSYHGRIFPNVGDFPTMGDFSYHGRFFLRWKIFPTLGDFSYQGRFFLRWEIFSIHGRFSPSWKIFSTYHGRFLLQKGIKESSSKKDCSLREILFAMGDKIYPWMFNLGRYIS